MLTTISYDTFENGMLFLGDLPGNASSNVRNVFNVPKNKVTWNVDISTLIIKGKEYENKEDNFEAQLTGYSNAGCITYVEIDTAASHNIDALEKLVKYAMSKDIPYLGINISLDTCRDS